MEVKSVYLDLQEWVKNGNVWRLESEAFKDPIEIKIWYENKELSEFNQKTEELREQIRLVWKSTIDWMNKWIEARDEREALNEELIRQKNSNTFLGEEIQKNKSELKELYKVVADLKWTVEMQSGTILKLQEQVKLLEKNTTKQPSVFHWKCFISWRESAGLWMFELPDGDYLLNAKYTIGEHNEYVTNKDDIVFEKIHVEGQRYVPFYKLEWGTELDTPTATIYYDLVFMPI